MRTFVLLLLALPPAASALPPFTPPSPDAASAEAQAVRALSLVASRDPDVASLQRAAARVADREGRAPALAARARWSALLPKLTAEYRHDQSANRVVGLQGSGEVDYLRFAPSDSVLVRATWELPSLVVGTEELAAAARAEAHARRREEAVEKVTKLFFERRRLRVALLLSPPAEPVARAQAEVEIARLAAEIDALTGGALTGGALTEPGP
ncbi:MAG TPA: hypothetical protein VEB43_12650 [Anaeromyxobacter sp.]|nr:hypothetical protein [Anaeromyxobacter sp.]